MKKKTNALAILREVWCVRQNGKILREIMPTTDCEPKESLIQRTKDYVKAIDPTNEIKKVISIKRIVD